VSQHQRVLVAGSPHQIYAFFSTCQGTGGVAEHETALHDVKCRLKILIAIWHVFAHPGLFAV